MTHSLWTAVVGGVVLAAPIAAQDATRNDAPHNDASDNPAFVLRSRSVDRWVNAIAPLLRDVVGPDEANNAAIQTRIIAAAVKVDPTRPLTVTGRFQTGGGSKWRIDESSLSGLLPTVSSKIELSETRIEFGEAFGVREVQDPTGPLGRTEFHADVDDGWAWITKDGLLASPEQRLAAVDQFQQSPGDLLQLTLSNIIAPEQRAAMVEQIWRDVARDLKKGPDEPDVVHSVRSEIQSALGRVLADGITELETLTLAGNVSDSGDAALAAALTWSEQGRTAGWLNGLQAVESRFGYLHSDPAVVRLRIAFRVPPRTARRYARWVDSAGDAAMSLAKAADKPRLMPLVTATQATLRSAVSSGRVDMLLDIVRTKEHLAVHGAVAYPGRTILDSAMKLIGDGPERSKRVVTIGDREFVRIGDPGNDPESLLGPRPSFWVTADEEAIYFALGSTAAVDSLANRISGSRETRLARPGTPRQSPPQALRSEWASVGQKLAQLSIDSDELSQALASAPSDPGSDDLRALLRLLGDQPVEVFATLAQNDGRLVVTLHLQRPLVVALGRATIR